MNRKRHRGTESVVAGSRRLQPAFFSLRSLFVRRLKPAATMCLCAFVPLCFAVAGTIVNSKHDLSSGSATTGPKAAGETQICVFCHTAHKPNPNIPLWNHSQTTQSFTFYSSNYLNAYLGFSVPTMMQLPGTRTKLCLSCHDGMTALGGVYNLGGAPGVITVTGNLGTGAALGTDLANDHPVLYSVRPGSGPPGQPGTNPEIQLPPGGDKVKVYGSDNLVECTSCHNPHDNTYGYFLVKSNANAAVCTTCHAKTGYTASVHPNSSAPYTPPGRSATTVGEWSCRNCHTPHGASATQSYLLRGSEENTCYNCHGNPPLTGAKNIKILFSKTTKHPAETISGKHKNPETDGSNFTYSPANNRHAECYDCHNPHQAKTGTHAPPTNLISNVLLGQWGVEPSYGATPGVPASSYTRQVFTDTTNYKERQLCFKCHTSYAFSASPPPGLTDQSIEFNVNNPSYHYIGIGSSSSKARTNPPPATSYVSPWTYTSKLYCSDCHASDSDADPRGPHGSANTRILRGHWTTLTGTRDNITGHLCFKCHSANVYSDDAPRNEPSDTGYNNGDKNLHYEHIRRIDTGCMTCHSKVPHGMNRPRLIVLRSDPAPYNDGVTPKIISYTPATPGNYTQSNCTTASGCH